MKRAAELTPTTTPSKLLNWVASEKTPEKKRGPSILLKASPTKQVQKRHMTSEPIKTYVFFDLECTDLIRNEGTSISYQRAPETSDEYREKLEQLCLQTRSDELPYITEMSFMAISRETFDEMKKERQELVKWNEDNPDERKELARYIPTNTHTRQLNPAITDWEWHSYEQRRCSSGRGVLVHPRRECLRNNTFCDEWPAVVHFLKSLPKPVLLVGHNALNYDLRVIYGEIVRNRMQEEFPIPQNVFFMDSYLMARKLDDDLAKELATVCKYIKFPKIPSKVDAAEEKIPDSLDPTHHPVIPPIREPTISNGVLAEDHPANILNWEQFSVAHQRKIRKEGFVRTENGGWTYRSNNGNRYSLGVLYEELVGGKFTAHYAQQDAEALMHVCLSYGEEFSQYGDRFAAGIPF